jgi:hypothetical protein
MPRPVAAAPRPPAARIASTRRAHRDLTAGRRAVELRGMPSGWYFRGFRPLPANKAKSPWGVPKTRATPWAQ